MVSHDLLHSTVTKQIPFNQRDLHSTPVFELAMDQRCQALVSKLETLDLSLLPNRNEADILSHHLLPQNHNLTRASSNRCHIVTLVTPE